MTTFPKTRAAALVDRAALADNFRTLSALADTASGRKTRTVAVVKANAYGHGVSIAIPTLLAAGCDFFAVATPEEALSVRVLAPDADILCLGFSPPALAGVLAKSSITQTVFSTAYARALSDAARAAGVRLGVHLKIDGGMCRLGFAPDGTAALLDVTSLTGLTVCGIYTHFPDPVNQKEVSRAAFRRFLSCRETLTRAGLSLFSHAASSAALLTVPEAVLDGARVGLALYGIPPVPCAIPLRRVMTVTAPIVQIHTVKSGTPVGYGGAFVTKRPSKIGTCPIGYADGLFRALEGEAVRIFTKEGTCFAPIVGHFCMDQTMLDLTDPSAAVGDTAVFLENAAANAEKIGSIPYEVLTAVSARVARVAVNDFHLTK